ncbi:MAG TPA: 50S ribosomal protein L1 [Myxococcales bacterium]|nr:50S ribosomal protein L1 [Myxococcales bacterium]
MAKGKKYRAALASFDRENRYPVSEAVNIVREFNTAKYDQTIEVAVNLGVNPKHADQMLRGAVVLPNGTGKTIRVIVFAKGDKEGEAKEAGADFVGGEDLVAKIKDGWFDFDTAIATPNMMVQVGKIGRLLGPRGLMPNPKVGTVTFDVGNAVRQAKAGKISFRTDKSGIIHAGIGKQSFDATKLEENLTTLMETLVKMKPSTAKGTYIKSVTLSTSHSPGVKVDANEIANQFRTSD